MESSGRPVCQEISGRFVEIVPMQRLKITPTIDFLPGAATYDNSILVEFVPEPNGVRMVVDIDEHPDRFWTEQSTMGFESQLTKIPAAVAKLTGD